MTHADELRTAATTLRNLAEAAAKDTGSPTWTAARTHPENPTWTSSTVLAGSVPVIHGGHPFLTGPAADYIAAVGPATGLAIADWLDSAAIESGLIGTGHHALTVARAINTTQEPTS